MKRHIATWSVVLSALATLGATPAWAAERISYRSMTDRAGDVVDSDGTKLNDARGDILQAAADYKADSVQFEVRIAQFTDPVKDPNWNSDSTYLLWTLETNGDAKGDFTIEYGNQDGQVYGAVFRVGAPDDAPAICSSPTVPTGPSGTYMLRLDPGCIGRPDSFAWSVEASYDTNPRDDDAPATEDLLPDEGFSPPVHAPADSPAAATGSAASAPADAAAPPPAATAGGPGNRPAEANDTAASGLSSTGAAAGGPSGAPGGAIPAGVGSSSARASARAAASSSDRTLDGPAGASGNPSGAAAEGTATGTGTRAAPRDGSGSSLLIGISVAAIVMLLAVVAVLVRTLRSRDPVAPEV